jgi:predicted dehydrogenase
LLNLLTEPDALKYRSSDLVRIGIIGAGKLSSSRIYPCLHMLPVDLVAVCDLDERKAGINAGKFGARSIYTDHHRMLREAELDAVIVCVGPAFHRALAIDVLETGRHVYTEKPPGVTSADAEAMLSASRRAGRICMTGFKKRFAPAYAKARAAIADAGFGTPSLLSVDYCCGPTYSNDPANPSSNFLLDFCIHLIDLSLFLFGPVTGVNALTREDLTYAVTLRFQNDALGTFAFSANRDWDVTAEKVELTGAAGRFITIENSVRMLRYEGRTLAQWHEPTFSTARGDSLIETGFAGELAEFCAAIHEKRQPESSISSALQTMRLYEAIKQSAATSRAVAVVPTELGSAN